MPNWHTAALAVLAACGATTAPPDDGARDDRVAARADPVDCAAYAGTVAVPGGPFVMGSDQGGRDERPPHVVDVTGFCLDRAERAAGEVLAWMAASGRPPARDDSRTLVPGREALAATELTWEEARDFCAAQGGRLPTEAEWEKAARGGCELGQDPAACDPGDARAWPWGDAPPSCAQASFLAPQGPGPFVQPCTDGPEPPGAHPGGASPYGALDLAGNAWEWVSDWYHPAVYGGARRDPGGPPEGPAHVLRGGAWNTLGTNLRVSNRMSGLVEGSASGVRCAFGGASPTPDSPPPLTLAPVSGRVARQDGAPLSGRALYVTAFAEEDLGPGGAPTPGASPTAELRLEPAGETVAFTLPLPAGRYLVAASVDGRPPRQPGEPPPVGWTPPSATGGIGSRYPVTAPQEGVEILLGPPPGGGP